MKHDLTRAAVAYLLDMWQPHKDLLPTLTVLYFLPLGLQSFFVSHMGDFVFYLSI